MGEVVSREELVERVRHDRAAGRTVAFANGCFDLLHVGHLRYLTAARALGEVLLVAVNSDASVRSLKGPGRPVIPEAERAELLLGLRCVDYATLFDEATPTAVIEALRPDIHVKGGDYRPEDLPEAEAIRRYGGRVVILPFVEGRSSTRMIERACGAAAFPVTEREAVKK